MECHIGVISGDGIGPEIVAEAKKVLDKAGEKYGHSFTYQDILMGGCSIDATGVPLTDEAIAAAKASDAVLMGSIGGNTQTSPWYKLAPELRPEAGLLKLRKSLNLFANLRPAYLYEELKQENASLRQLLAEKEVEISELQNSRKELEAMYTNLKTARILSINDNELRDTKQRLAKLVREVDKCIALLNE